MKKNGQKNGQNTYKFAIWVDQKETNFENFDALVAWLPDILELLLHFLKLLRRVMSLPHTLSFL